MNKNRLFFLGACLVILALMGTACGGSAPTQTTDTQANPTAASQSNLLLPVSYAKDIQPIFNANCVGCHGGAGGLTLSNYESLMVGGKTGAVIVAADPETSVLYKRITGTSQPRMPKGGASLSQDKIDLIGNWIKEGAANN